MKRPNRMVSFLIFLLSLTLAMPPGLLAQSASTDPQSGKELTWPRVHQENGLTISIYQPQIERWEDDRIETRTAVAMQSAGASSPTYGVVWMAARADVDKAARIVTLRDFKITEVKFPTEPSKEGTYLKYLGKYFPQGVKTVALDHLETSFAISQAVKKGLEVQVKNDPPNIIFSAVPAVLIIVDGKPVFRPVEGQNTERIVNTRALIVKTGGRLYLQAMNDWYEASELDGSWTVAKTVPPSLEQIKQSLVAAKQVDPMETPKNAVPFQTPPAIYVSTVPAELIQSDGQPQFLPIEGTELLQVKNSDNIIFMEVKTNDYYVLLSGRWFKAKSLIGPWAFVPGKDLPPDLAKIPPDHPRANALVSVPGTPQAEEAVIANSIPQTSTVKRREAKLETAYDGEPRFEPIASTPLQYAVNSPLPVIRVDAGSYYSVQNGVWFVGPSPTGPWSAATNVPAVIYSIPPSSPLYYVTYVRVYGSTPDEVYEGYTPGYLGTVVSPDDVVVYGTGYYYPPYIGTYWIGSPYTYGFGAGFGWTAFTGFAFGFSAGAVWGTWCHPWWGPFGWGWYHGRRYSYVDLNHVNIYRHWNRGVVSINHRYSGNEFRNGRWSQTGRKTFNPYSGRQRVGERVWDVNSKRVMPRSHSVSRPTRDIGNNIFAGKDGRVYRYNLSSNNWERSTPKGWQNVQRDRGFQNQNRQLNQERASRNIGQQRFNNIRSSGGFKSSRQTPPRQMPQRHHTRHNVMEAAPAGAADVSINGLLPLRVQRY